jgi:predicted phage terminase large subunit-like protein
VSTRVNDPKTSAMVVVMQRCHQQDLSGHLLEQGGWEHLCLPAEYEGTTRKTSIGFYDPRKEMGELLWKERYGTPEIEDLKRRLGSYAAAGQLQQRPSPLGGGIFKRHWWRYWQPPGANLPPVIVQLPDGTYQSIHPVCRPTRGVEQIQSWDCAFKDLETSDFVVGQMWGRVGAGYFLGDQVRDRMDCPTTVKAVRKLSERYPGSLAKLIEDKANGSAVIQMLQHEIPGILPVNPEGGKVARATAVSPLIEAGNVYLPHPSIAPWVNDFVEEFAAFPNGAHDDQVDAATQALLRWNMIPRQPVVYVSEYEYEQFSQISPI